MNSSPLNPEAPVFVPGSVAGADVLLAESPRKPLPMDDIELPDVAQFETEADIRPAELLDLDNCDQLNGHHNVSVDEAVKEPFNGNDDRCNMDSLGFGFNVGIEPDKVKDVGLIQDFERIQKDTTDFCNIQVFQTHTESNPFDDEGNDELFERLKNKERDPMSMSFYQEKDDDTCERLSKNDSHVDLNAVQPLPDSDDEDIQQNGVCENVKEIDKENLNPVQNRVLYDTETNMLEPNNDIIILNDKTDAFSNNLCNLGVEENFVDYNITSSNNIQSLSNMEFESSNITQETVLQTDTPESHKLLFEQIPEIPDGKSSELGFTNDDNQDPSESEKDTRLITPQDEILQDEMESKIESCTEEVQSQFKEEIHEQFEAEQAPSVQSVKSVDDAFTVDHKDSQFGAPLDIPSNTHHTEVGKSQEIISSSSSLKQDVQENLEVDIHQHIDIPDDMNDEVEELIGESDKEMVADIPEVQINTVSSENTYVDEQFMSEEICESQEIIQSESLAQEESLVLKESTPSQSPLPTESPLPDDHALQSNEVPASGASPLPMEDITSHHLPMPEEATYNDEILICPKSPLPSGFNEVESEFSKAQSPSPVQTVFETNETPVNTLDLNSEDNILIDDVTVVQSQPLTQVPITESLLPTETSIPAKSPVPEEHEVQNELCLPKGSSLPADVSEPTLVHEEINITEMSSTMHDIQEALDDIVADEISMELRNKSPLPAEVPLPRESPILAESPVPAESPAPTVSPIPVECEIRDESTFSVDNSALTETMIVTESPVPTDSPIPAMSPIPRESPIPAKSPIPQESLIPTESPLPVESSVPSKSPIPVECPAPAESPIPVECPAPAKSPIPAESPVPVEASLPVEPLSIIETSPVPTEHVILAEESVEVASAPVESPITVETLELVDQPKLDQVPAQLTNLTNEFISQTDQVESAFVAHSPVLETSSAPAPDVVPDEPIDHGQLSRSELVTDIDIGIPESHAQEICVPVTSEIHLDETVHPPAATTPPPTPAVEPAPPAVSEAPLAADPAAPTLAAAAVAVAGAAVAGAVVAAKTKTSAPAKKSPTTPTVKSDTRTTKVAPKGSTTPRTPTTAAKKTEAGRPATAPSRPTAAKTPTTATKTLTPATKVATATSKTTTPASKPATKSATPASRTTSATKQVPSATKSTTTASKPTTPAAVAASRTSAAKPGSPTTKPAVREAPTVARAAPKPAAAPRPAATKPAPKTAPAPRPALARAAPAAAKPALAKPKLKPADKPLTNGDVKDTKPAAKPAPRPAAARPAPRAPAAAPAKTAAAKPAPRATAPLDKQSKDLANKRITAKTAPPRTALTKTATGAKNAVMKSVPRKPTDSHQKEQAVKALPNGGAESPVKSPASPPAPDNALLPDVIA